MNVNPNSQKSETRLIRRTSKARQEQIIAAALELISHDGVESLSVAAVARQIGMVPSALYRHFSGKEEILLAVNAMICTNLIENVHRVEEITFDPIQRLELLLQRHVKLVRHKPGIARYVFSTAVLPCGKERKIALFGGVQAYLHEVENIIATAQHKGMITSDYTSSSLAHMFLGLVQPAIFLNQLGDGNYPMEDRVKEGWKMFKHTLSKNQEGL
jgi:AcrR family transcriptional regulator